MSTDDSVEPKTSTAISLRSVRITEFSKLNSWEPLANSLLRKRIAQIGEHMDLHKLYPNPSQYKSSCQASFKKPRSPLRSPQSPKELSRSQ